MSTLSKNCVTTVKYWSILEEMIRLLNSLEKENKKEVIQQQMKAMPSKTFGTKIYGPEIIIRAFEYFATSRSLYNRLRVDYQLPSASTLTRITSKVSKLSETTFLHGVFKCLREPKTLCTDA